MEVVGGERLGGDGGADDLHELGGSLEGSLLAPPRYKMLIVTWLAVFPLLTAFNYALQPVFQGMPIWLRVLIGTTLVVPLMTYVVMPRMTRLFKAWLYPVWSEGGPSDVEIGDDHD